MSCDDCIVPLSKCDFLQMRADKCPLIEIVECKDCKHYITPYENIIDADGLCDNMQVLKDKNDYCSLGERRADDSNT